jgi:outer membrane protein TolC
MDVSFPAVPPALPSELLERRPDIAAAERRMAAANAQIGVAEAAYYPSVSLFAGGGFGNRDFEGGASYGWILFDAGLRQAQSAQASAAYDETVADYRQTIVAAFREVEDNLAALRVLEEEAAVQAVAVRAARESVTIANNQYRAGIVSYLSVVVVQAGALNNERAELGILCRRLVASVTLIKALGGGWEAEAPKAARAPNG